MIETALNLFINWLLEIGDFKKIISVVRPTLLYFWLACHAALDAASSICFSGFLLPQE
jgi:hypothetical protein